METKELREDMEQYESEVIHRFCEGNLLRDLSGIDEATFKELLLQKRLFSLEFFERFYNTAICGLDDEEAKEIGRGLILEEYATGGPTHREDTVYDLGRIGIPKLEILTANVSPGTQRTIDSTIALVQYDGNTDYDVRTVTALRVAGEVLAGVEMGLICQELERRYGLSKADSKFYWPHAEHDKKTVPIGEAGVSHSDRFGQVLVRLVSSYSDLEVVKDSMERSYEARAGFYQQFES